MKKLIKLKYKIKFLRHGIGRASPKGAFQFTN